MTKTNQGAPAARATPGPWVERWPEDEENDSVGRYATGAIGQKVFLRLATVDLQQTGQATHSYDYAKAERRANAKLIAQAPVLAEYIADLVRDPPACRSTLSAAAPFPGCDCWPCELVRKGRRLLGAAGVKP